MNIPRVLTIAGSDSGGGAGIQADIKTITAMGCYGMTVITALTAQNTIGVQDIHGVPMEFIDRQFESVMPDIGADAAKTGMLATPEVVAVVAKNIDRYGIKRLVVDPVMIAKGGASLLTGDARNSIIEQLLPRAMVITPNIPEAEVLTGMKIANQDQMMRAAEKLMEYGSKAVVVKGGHAEGDAVDIFYDGVEFVTFSHPRIDTKNTHGTGCTFSAAIASGLAANMTIIEAVSEAKDFVSHAISHAMAIGQGHGPTNHVASIVNNREAIRCIEDLKEASIMLHRGRCGHIIPEVQSNMGYALPYAKTHSDVAAFPGRLVRLNDHVVRVKDPSFGASRHIANIILTVMRHDPSYRCVMNIRYSEDIVEACRKLGMSVDSFSRDKEPEDTKLSEGSSLEWGTGQVLDGRDDIPEVIFDRGGQGKEPMVRILGRTPIDVADRVLAVAEAVRK